MKKTAMIIAFAFMASCSFAQNQITSKNGTPILPEEKDWAIGFNAAPFFDVIKGLFSSSDSSGSDYTKFTKNHPLTIYGKLVRNANTMWRASARIYYNQTKTNYVTDLDSANGSPFFTPQYGSDVLKASQKGVTLGFGIEKRRGKGRVQGYYGPEAMIGFGSRDTSATYANQITLENQTPSMSPVFAALPNNARVTETKSGSQFLIAIRAFIGVEYFFMAKASVGAELGWGISYLSQGEPSINIEFWDPSLNSGAGGVNRTRIPSDGYFKGKSSSLNIDTDNAYGAINLFFYF